MSAPADDRLPPRAARALVLQRLVPALVHGAASALSVVRGVLELGAEARDEERGLALRGLGELGARLAALGAFAREPSALEGPRDLQAICASARLLLPPLAEALGVALEIRAPRSRSPRNAPVVLADSRLESLWLRLAAGGTLALAAGERSGPPPARVRLRARAAGGTGWLSLARDGVGPAGPARTGEREALDELERLARERGWKLLVRSKERAWACRLGMPLASVPVEERGEPGDRGTGTERAVAAPGRRGRVLLLQEAGELRELCASVLREHGFSVVEGGTSPGRGGFDLALVGGELARADPGLLARLQREGCARIACLGRWRGERGERPELEAPFRPGQLLSFVEGLLVSR